MTVKTTKVANYTDAQAAKMVEDYMAGVSVETIAASVSRSVKSVIAKLAREKVYVAKVRTAKTSEGATTKEDLAASIGDALGMTADEVASIAKANKAALVKVWNALQMAAHVTDGTVTEDDLAAADSVDAETFATE